MAFSLLIKPVSSDCNLRCRYCYYRTDEQPGSNTEPVAPRMSEDILEQVIRSYMQTEQDIYSMVWHGGEPTLLPVEFFKKAIELQKLHATKGSRIANSLQTNGTIISEELATLLGRYRFSCGVSLDGPPKIHNRFRRSAGDNHTYERVQRGIATLSGKGVELNILVLVSSANVDKPLEIYRYLKKKGFRHIQFIPCVEYDVRGRPTPFSIKTEEWGNFLTAVFDEWYRHDLANVSIRQFESILALLVHNAAIDCYNSSGCDRYLVIEYNGDVYPCDFFVKPEYKLGNILEDSFESILESVAYKRFSSQKVKWPKECDGCDFQPLCMGDCPKFRRRGNLSTDNLSHLCRGWKYFYRQSLDRFRILAKRIELAQHRQNEI